ncbi:MAG: ATP-binding cassette domain-containing protein [Peptococcaceae bacterium]|nr:ATP-binding cassette domain-containing protein [Peptococcaceae bacterium]MDH7525401.1 ATP-binding cassette domain-containing protein [Peptococcaceae bacterium]
MLELQNVSYNGEDDTPVLKDINLTLQDRKFYVITGPNGGGKSSLAKVIMGIYQPSAGRIVLDGEDITGLGVTERARRGIGFAFQHPPRFKGITVGELLHLAGGSQKTAAGCNQLVDVGLCPKDYTGREVNGSLSGGELKRVEIATLLGRKLKIAIFDEPEAGIDLWSFGRLTETFRRIHASNEQTTVIISHQERILELADEIILVAEGQVQERGEKEKLLARILQECDCSKNCLERAVGANECR